MPSVSVRLNPFPRISEQDVIIAAALASKKESNDPIDIAVFSRFDQLTPPPDTASHETLDFVPFDPVNKFSKASNPGPIRRSVRSSKGSAPAIAVLTGNNGALSSTLDGWVNGFAEKGFRALGVARTDHSRNVAVSWPDWILRSAREDSGATITEAKKLGVNVKMVTGDRW